LLDLVKYQESLMHLQKNAGSRAINDQIKDCIKKHLSH
jgi:hypothetical protein